MATEIKMPQWAMTLSEGTVMKWLKNPGDEIAKGEDLCEIEEAKVTDVFESPVSGILIEILVAEGETVPVMTAICVIDEL